MSRRGGAAVERKCRVMQGGQELQESVFMERVGREGEIRDCRHPKKRRVNICRYPRPGSFTSQRQPRWREHFQVQIHPTPAFECFDLFLVRKLYSSTACKQDNRYSYSFANVE